MCFVLTRTRRSFLVPASRRFRTLAQITAKWRNSLAIFQALQQHYAEHGFDIDLGIYIKNMVAFATGQSRS